MNIYAAVESIMCKKSIVTANANDELTKVKEIFDNHSFHHLPIVENGLIKGIVSKSDFLLFQRQTFNEWDKKLEKRRLENFQVKDIMVDRIAILEPKSSIDSALKIFKENRFHAIPIIEDEKLVGIVTTHDIIVKLLDKDEVAA